jgi:hypothetical protein
LKPGFVVYALPRSRTAWLSKFLTYGGWSCWHEQAIHMRTLNDIRTVISWPQTGVVETAMAQGWRIIHHYHPTLNAVVIRRPLEDVVKSMLAIDLKGYAHYDEPRLRKVMAYGNRMLDEIAAQPGTLVLDFDQLATREGCKAVFEHCLPYPFDDEWWQAHKDRNIQCDVASVIRYYHENRPEIDGFKKLCWRELRRLRASGQISKH